jgi:FAD/FMN-containing dehydrogenase/Fe-S oxidoreductase
MSRFTELQRDALAHQLLKNQSGEVRFDDTSRRLYSTDASIYQIEPLGVVLPRTPQDVVAIVQIAAEAEVPITPRGGGTSLSGQSIGPGIVLDCSKYLRKVLEFDRGARLARVEPGVVLDDLNRELGGHGLQFGPDVATASRANLGGLIGNNSAGARSIIYGKTLDHVRRLGVVLADGSRAEFGPMAPSEWDQRASGRAPQARLYQQVGEVVRRDQHEIRHRFPRILRRVSGYNLDVLCSGLCPDDGVPPTPIGLHQILVGSEGTLAVITEADLNLVAYPAARGLLVPQFATLAAALDALDACLEFRPSAVELLDDMLLELTRDNLALHDTMQAIRGRPQAILLVEIQGDDSGEVADRVERLDRKLAGIPGLIAAVQALDAAQRESLWNLRRAGMPLLYGMRGDRKPVTFVEDCAVAPARLPEFALRFRDLLRRHGTDGAFYGHASVGCLHIRPLLNLKDAGDVARMRRITEDVTDLVLEFGGSLSGEHGDGLARSEWNEKMFGPVIYKAFADVKRAFDPKGLLNPGRVVAGPPMTQNLRYPPGYSPLQPPIVFDYSRQEGFVRSVEMCNGSGACRKVDGGTMCPSYRATLDERDSTRGRANALRRALAGEAPHRDLRGRALYDVFDLCLMCKACKSECPSNVDVAKLKAEFLQLHYRGRARPLGEYLIAYLPRLNRLGAPFAPALNWIQQRGAVRWLLEKTAGIDRRRSLPALHRDHLRHWFGRHSPDSRAGTHGEVLLLADCFTAYNEPHIGRAAVRVLEHAGYGVALADSICCGRTLISKGFLHEARELVRAQAPILAQRVADGTPLLGLEPSCLLTLVDEWTELAPGPDTQAVAAACHLTDDWLARQAAADRADLELWPRREKCIVHGHCHQKALVGTGGTAAALRLVKGLDVTVLDTGCCGMAGSFGFEKEHYELSVKIAGLALIPSLAAAPEAVVVAPGTSCRHQIHDLTSRRALHPLELLEEQLAPAGE